MRTDISFEMYKKMIDTFMPSKCMKEFLMYGERIITDEMRICELILYSPVSLKTKVDWLNRLSGICTKNSEGLYEKAYQAAHKALLLLEQSHDDNLIWIVEDCWYDYDTHEQKEVFVGACDSYESVIHFIRSERAEELEYSEDDEIGETWFRITLMQRNVETGKYEHLYRFYEVNEEICFFEDMQFYGKSISKKQNGYFKENWPFDYTNPFRSSLGFNPAKPFKPGDILEIKYGPFAPKLDVVILEIDEDYNDDVYPTVLVRKKFTESEYWDIASLQGTLPLVAYKHIDVISPLFYVEKMDALPGSKDDEILTKVSKLIKENSELGKKLWNDINADGLYCFTGEDIRNWIVRHQSVNQGKL